MWSRIALLAVALPVVGIPVRLVPSASASKASRQTSPPETRAAFERLDGLIGTWTSIERGGNRPSTTTTFKRTGGGKAILNEAGGMATVYHPDNAHLMLTHYCGNGTQTRMRLQAYDGKTLRFAMFDVTNLASPATYHTTHADVIFTSEDKVTIAYRGIVDGQELNQTFDLTRQR